MNDTPGLDSVQEAAEAAGREPIGDPPIGEPPPDDDDDDDEDDEDDENEEPPDDEPEDGELSPHRCRSKTAWGFATRRRKPALFRCVEGAARKVSSLGRLQRGGWRGLGGYVSLAASRLLRATGYA